MKENGNMPRLTATHMRVYAVYRGVERQELERRKHRYEENYQGEPQYSQLYGALKTLECLMDLGWMLTQGCNERELLAKLQQKYHEWTGMLTYQREVKANYQRGLTEIACYQAEGSIPVWEQWLPAVEWLVSAERTKLPQHKEMRRRFHLPVPTEEDRQRAIRLDTAVMTVYQEVYSYCDEKRECEAALDDIEYGTYHGCQIVRNYLMNWRGTVPVLDALQRRIQELCDSYSHYVRGCQEQIDTYEHDVAKWEQDNWCNYYRGPDESPSETEREHFRSHYRREYGPEKLGAEIKITQDFIDRLEEILQASYAAQ